MRLLAFDPAVNVPGAAVFQDGILVSARHFKGKGFRGDFNHILYLASDIVDWAGQVTAFAAEWQTLRGFRDVKAIESQAPLWAIVGTVAGMLQVATSVYTPQEWKQGKSKNHAARKVLRTLTDKEEEGILDIGAFHLDLTECERALVSTGKEPECKHPTMNAIEAIGIGLHHLGRFEKLRVFPR